MFRQKLAELIAGHDNGCSARVYTGVTLAAFLPSHGRDSRMRAVNLIDDFWHGDAKNIHKMDAERFIESVWADERFPLLSGLGANKNKLVNNGTRQLYRMMSGQAVNSEGGDAIGTLPTYIELGSSTTTVTDAALNNLGCYTPIVSAGLAVASGTVTPVTTDANYTNDTFQIQKTNFSNGIGTDVVVREAAILNNDATKIALCRTATTVTTVVPAGNLSVTYTFRFVAT